VYRAGGVIVVARTEPRVVKNETAARGGLPVATALVWVVVAVVSTTLAWVRSLADTPDRMAPAPDIFPVEDVAVTVTVAPESAAAIVRVK
jgi:hypothetical protein